MTGFMTEEKLSNSFCEKKTVDSQKVTQFLVGTYYYSKACWLEIHNYLKLQTVL